MICKQIIIRFQFFQSCKIAKIFREFWNLIKSDVKSLKFCKKA